MGRPCASDPKKARWDWSKISKAFNVYITIEFKTYLNIGTCSFILKNVKIFVFNRITLAFLDSHFLRLIRKFWF